MQISRKPGFTLVEVLVVIAIIAVIAALSFTLLPKMLLKGKAAKQVENMRQFGPLFGLYAADHQMRLPAAKTEVTQPDQTTLVQFWHEVLLAQVFPNTDPADFKTKAWWDANDTFMRNPLFKESATPRGWAPENPGYGMNGMIAENLAALSDDAKSPEELDAVSTPLAAIPEPPRTPLVAPSDNYTFRYDETEIGSFRTGTLKEFLSNGQVPVLFVDGHVETISPAEYSNRNLDEMPLAPATEP